MTGDNLMCFSYPCPFCGYPPCSARPQFGMALQGVLLPHAACRGLTLQRLWSDFGGQCRVAVAWSDEGSREAWMWPPVQQLWFNAQRRCALLLLPSLSPSHMSI